MFAEKQSKKRLPSPPSFDVYKDSCGKDVTSNIDILY